MLFNSVAFLLFFPTVVVIYFVLPHRLRWLWLLAASLFFYMYWKVLYGFLLLTPLRWIIRPASAWGAPGPPQCAKVCSVSV
jgi:hypothetical protein